TTNLTVNPVYHVSEDITILEGESYNGWSESGTYERTLAASAGCDSIVTTRITVKQLQHQTIPLEKGWNIFSSWLAPVNNNMNDVLAKLQQENLLIAVQDEAGNTFEKEGSEWVNNIGEFTKSEGYIIQVQSPVDLKISGYPVNLPLNIPLTAGWNIISFPYNGAIDAMSVLQPLIDDGILEKVQDEQGSSIENWGSSVGWVNGIGSFAAGEGYLVQVTQNGMLPIFENYEKSTQLVANNLQPSYFNVDFEGNGLGHMNINIRNLLQSGLKVGDELAAYDGEICVGAVKLSESNINMNVVSIAASASDKKGTNGFTDENLIELKVWHINKSAAFQPQLEVVKGNMKYQKHTSLFVKLINQEIIDANEFESIKIDIFPNPARDNVTL
ncbi:MAG: hypothetical protein LC658_06780, partial [Bacteroidales bacterium]|nr:hypothetical protein [Bacteroidales bacterium]